MKAGMVGALFIQAVGLQLQTSNFKLQTSKPIIVKIIETPKDPTGIADVLLGSLGLTGVIVLVALLFGLVFGGVLFWIRRRQM